MTSSRRGCGRAKRPIAATALSLLIAACADLGASPDPPIDPLTATWNGGVADLLSQRCGGCHTPPFNSGRTDFSFECYDRADCGGTKDGASDKADRIRARAVDAGSMPPSGPLSPTERDLLEEWIDAGTPLD